VRKQGEPIIWFGLATCGLAAGAGELVEAVQAELDELGIRAQIVPTGCIGACFVEPMMDIEKPGAPRISYAQMTPEKARSIVRAYLKEGDPCAGQALGTLGEGRSPEFPACSSFLSSLPRCGSRRGTRG
jgi:NADH-quinone oxidoreductase subunit F